MKKKSHSTDNLANKNFDEASAAAKCYNDFWSNKLRALETILNNKPKEIAITNQTK